MRSLAVLIVLFPLAAHGIIVSESLDPGLFGNLDRFEDVPNLHLARGSAPVSFTNSMVYLQNAFPDVYGAKGLVDYAGTVPTESELASVADTLAGPTYMNWEERWDSCFGCLQEPGLSYAEVFNSAIAGHMKYIDEKALDTTRWEVWDYASESDFREFITRHLQRGGVVHVELIDVAAGSITRTYIPVTGIEYDSSSPYGTLSYIDPWDGSAQTSAMSTLALAYPRGFTNVFGRMVAVSIVPEPSTWALASLALGIFVFNRKRIMARA